MNPRVRPRQEDALPLVTPCRGCAGNGVGQHVPPRIAQLIEVHQPFRLTRKRDVYMRLVPVTSGVDTTAEPCVDHAPLAPLVKRIEARLAAGFVPDEADRWFVDEMLAHWHEYACSWCHGTGVPQLSVHALEIGVR